MRPMKDPAPSRLAYRLHRWMLTPAVRFSLRVALPVGVVALAAGMWLADESRRATLTGLAEDLRRSVAERPEFMVRLMRIDGAAPELAARIRHELPLSLPVSSFDLDPEAIRTRVASLAPVAAAVVGIKPGGILQISVTERAPAFVWRHEDGLTLIDAAGTSLGQIDQRRDRADLPLIAGLGADKAATEARALLQASVPLGDRMRGLVRVGERRWDVVLDRDQRILLPEKQPIRALERVIALSNVKKMLERDVALIDMRLGARPTLRMNENAAEAWWQARKINEDGQDG